MNTKTNKKGFALIDVLVAIVLIGAAVIVIGVVQPTLRVSRLSYSYVIANTIAQTKLDELRATGFANLANQANTSFTDTNLSQLLDGSANYTIADYDADGDSTVEDDIKVITVVVNWTEGGQSKNRTLSTLAARTGLVQ